MGRRVNAPVRGSHGYYPRARASSINPRVRSWPDVDGEPRLLGFPAYKVGMTHIVKIEGYKLSPLYGQEVVTPVTVLETPPIFIAGLRLYRVNEYGALETFSEVVLSNLPKHAYRLIKPAPRLDEGETQRVGKSRKRYIVEIKAGGDGTQEVKFSEDLRMWIEKMRSILDKVREIRILGLTQPYLTGIGKKRPELIEIKIGASRIEDAFNYGVNLLGREVHLPSLEYIAETARRWIGNSHQDVKNRIEELKTQLKHVYAGIFEPGKLVDVIGVTKGKGFEGVVKRHGVKIMPRWHKHRKGYRRIGSVGPATPGVMRTVPRPGQLGFHRRVEYNKRVAWLGVDLSMIGLGLIPEINPKSGFKHYGLVKNDYIVVEGSVMGPPKRLIMLRAPIRPGKPSEVEYEVAYIHI